MSKKLFRSRAPLRIGLAGGGTDVSPYTDLYGGAVLNATISLYAHASLELLDEPIVILSAADRGEEIRLPATAELPMEEPLLLLRGVYNRIVRDFVGRPLPLRLTTSVDVPPGSGLGTSSTLVVALIGSFVEALSLPLGEYEIARLAYEIERIDLRQAGGRQDQYAATFGGVNFMEFYAEERVIVNPLRIKPEYLYELEHDLLLYYTATSRFSSAIIESQQEKVRTGAKDSIEATHRLKEEAFRMKEALLKGQINQIGEILDAGFQYKRKLAEGISTPLIDEIYEAARKAGATGGKISGAGGGGFMVFYCPGTARYAVEAALKAFGGRSFPYHFVKHGLTTWTAKL
ncbi:MAG: dehydrogenase [Bacteroidia bacterium]|nr:dehydrogenase [Bacteroidia bacterium]MCX7652903.1 dehydrogenase [Bacteroidia bacterium]MDW8416629.1 dehydrogenase [Bacteroidia bacterium]